MGTFEKQFYLRSFRDRSILFHLSDGVREEALAGLTEELVANGTLVVIAASRFAASSRVRRVDASDLAAPARRLVAATGELLATGVGRVRRPARMKKSAALALSAQLALRLGVHKLVVVDPRGGLHAGDTALSFVTAAAAARRSAERQPIGAWTAAEIETLVAAVREGLDSVNLTTADGVSDELLTYEGSGTLLTRSEYCRVDRLGVDDFAQANGLLDRGEKEGFLLPRGPEERAHILLSAYGAWFEGRLAGIASLDVDSYRRRRMAEIVGLYTITRFAGEGVGVRMVEALVRAARQEGYEAVFACTSNARAARFFERNGFAPVPPAKVPKKKWRRRRGVLPQVFLRPLVRGRPA